MEEKKQKIEKQQLAKEGMKAISEIEESMKLENLIKDNAVEFKSGEITYRIRKPNYTEQQEIDTERRKKYIKFVSDDSYLFRKQWIEKYKKKGIDINKMSNDILKLQDEVKSLLLRLAKTSTPSSVEQLKKEITRLRDKQYSLSIEKTDLLSFSIEDQLTIFVNGYATYVVLEKKEKDKFVKVYKDYTAFCSSSDSDLIGKSFYYINFLMYSGETLNVKEPKKTS